jgi:hypothetical protein
LHVVTNLWQSEAFMFDVSQEAPIRIGEAAHLADTHFSTVFRWILRGAKSPTGERIRLQAVRLGGKWVTSRESLKRFTEALTPRLEDSPSPIIRTEGQRTRASEKAAKELDALGI